MYTYFIETLVSAASITDARHIFLTACAHYGFNLVQYRANFSIDIPVESLRQAPVILGNLPRPMRRMVEIPDLLDWPCDASGSMAAADLAAHLDSAALRDALQVHGLGHMQVVSLRDQVQAACGAVMLWPNAGSGPARLRECWDRGGPHLQTIAALMHMRVATLSRDRPGRDLTPRQREVLLWRSMGKTVSEISTILGITVATVEKHLRLARENLGVETTPQAVLKAHVTRQLFDGHPPAPGSMLMSGEG